MEEGEERGGRGKGRDGGVREGKGEGGERGGRERGGRGKGREGKGREGKGEGGERGGRERGGRGKGREGKGREGKGEGGERGGRGKGREEGHSEVRCVQLNTITYPHPSILSHFKMLRYGVDYTKLASYMPMQVFYIHTIKFMKCSWSRTFPEWWLCITSQGSLLQIHIVYM